MLSRTGTIEIGGKEYPAAFDLNVIELVQERYGALETLAERIQQIKELKWFLSTLINEGISKERFEKGESCEPITEDKIGMLLDINDMPKLNEALSHIVNVSLPKTEGDSKNSPPTQRKK